MPARLIAYVPDLPARTCVLAAGARLRIGRAPDAGLVLDHGSVSRQHAELDGGGDVWQLSDLGSSNGCFIDDRRLLKLRLPASAWLRFGHVYCSFEQISDAELARIEDLGEARRRLSQAESQRLAESLPRHAHGHGHFSVLLDDVLRTVAEIARCPRGFVLLAREENFAVAASRGLDPGAMTGGRFSGSVGVVRRVLAEHRPLVVNEVDKESWLAGRPSVVAGGLCSILCLPLLDGGRLLGAIYLDRNSPGDPITAFDLELIADFTERATSWLRASTAMDQLERLPSWQDIVVSHEHGVH
jgi:pSer/pThr/pTyr-binding forkhead associated (FHA) protein